MPEARSLFFPKTRRLVRDSDFERVKREGWTKRGKLIMLGALEVKGSGVPRAGFVVSRRLRSAVVRNRVRRRLREIVRTHQLNLRDDIWICSLQGVLRRLPVIVRWKMNGCVWQSALLSSSDARFCSFFCSCLSIHALAGSLF